MITDKELLLAQSDEITRLIADRDRWKAEALAARDAIEIFPIDILEQLLIIPECNKKLSLYLELRRKNEMEAE